MILPANPDHPRRITLSIGQGGCGKTSQCVRALVNIPWACAFIFDLTGQFSAKLKQPWVRTAKQCDEALARRIVCLNPTGMWKASETDKAFEWFAQWAFERSQTGPGRKILVADDSWDYMTNTHLTDALANVIKLGRFWNLEFWGITHRAMEYHVSVRAQVTEWIAFRSLPNDLKELQDYWPGVMKAVHLPRFEWLGYDAQTGHEGRYKLAAV